MSQLFYLSAEQLECIKPFFPLSHGIPRVDGLKVISGIIYVIKHGLQWKDAPREYGPYKTLHNHFFALESDGCLQQYFYRVGKNSRKRRSIDDRCDPPQSPSYRRQFAQKRALSRCIRRTKGGPNSKLHAVCDGHGRPLAMTLTEGQVSDCKGAALLMDALPEARELLADRGYDAGWVRDALLARGITPCIHPKKN